MRVERNGWVDDHSPIQASNRQNKCPNCGSSNYRETVSREECASCGLVCDYWGGGTNSVYEAYLRAHHDRLEAAQQAQLAEDHSVYDTDD